MNIGGRLGTYWQDRRIRYSAAAIMSAAIPFVLTLFDYGWRPFRSTYPTGFGSQYFDNQAEAFLEGRLWIPDGLLGIEAFRHNGHEYLYFGPLPAILRLPIVAITNRFEARMCAPSILIAWLIAAGFSAALVWRIRALMLPDRDVGRGEALLLAALVALVTGGSALLFLAANPWTYSEALMWSIAATLAAMLGLIRTLARPSAGAIALTGAATLAAALSRVTAGWGCGLAVLGAALLVYMSPAWRPHRRLAPWILAAGAIPLIVGIMVNLAKFGHPILLPFDEQGFTDTSATRRQVLLDGGFTGSRFLPSTLYNSLRPNGVRFSTVFPFVTAPPQAVQVGDAMLDMRYRTMSATAAMPVLFLLGGYGIARIFRRGSGALAILRIPVIGTAAVLGGLLTIGYIAQRYIAEFVPVLLIASTVGLVSLIHRAQAWRTRSRRLAVAVAFVAVAAGFVGTLTTSLSMSRLAAGGTRLRELVDLQARLSDVTGRPLDGLVTRRERPPDQSSPDEVVVVGDCDVMFAGTSDLYDPWRLIEARPTTLDVAIVEAPPRPLKVDLVRFAGYRDVTLRLEFDRRGRYRLVISDSIIGPTATDWKRVPQGGSGLTVELGADVDLGYYTINIPGHLFNVPLKTDETRPDLIAEHMVPVLVSDADLQGTGVEVIVTKDPASDLCRRIEPDA